MPMTPPHPAVRYPRAGFSDGDRTEIETLRDGIVCAVNKPEGGDSARLLVLYATPNGSSVQETLGRRPRSGSEWKYDIQHVLAQVRAFRAITRRTVTLAVLQAPGMSWPAWRERARDSAGSIRSIVSDIRSRLAPDGGLALLGHSGGGSFLLGLLESGTVPERVERIAFLDAVYSFDHRLHAEALLTWLDGDAERRFLSVAYDDRTVTLDGKPIVSASGGTQRATSRLRAALDAHRPLVKSLVGDCDRWTDAKGQIDVRVDRNYSNIILHSALVGDKNGVLHALSFGITGLGDPFGEPRRYTRFIDPVDDGPLLRLPSRPADAMAGSDIAALPSMHLLPTREEVLLREWTAGNVPDFLRQLRRVTYKARDGQGTDRAVTIWATADCASVGWDDDFIRTPLTPMTAQRFADAAGCLLPTPRMVDEIDRVAEAPLQPRPLLRAREAWTSFVTHHTIIQEQRRAIPNGPILCGTKKDIVLCKDLADRIGKVAIYGWRRNDGRPIQPLSLVHAATYVDYSHGVRLVADNAVIDGREVALSAALQDARDAWLFSDEGPLSHIRYPLRGD